jgi:hypothetical protein
MATNRSLAFVKLTGLCTVVKCFKSNFNIHINNDHERWIKSAQQKYGYKKQFWVELIKKQEGRCKLTGAKLLFNKENGTPACHPLYASVDHIEPGCDDDFQILCYDINDLKGHLSLPLLAALVRTKEWKRFAVAWKKNGENIGFQ